MLTSSNPNPPPPFLARCPKRMRTVTVLTLVKATAYGSIHVRCSGSYSQRVVSMLTMLAGTTEDLRCGLAQAIESRLDWLCFRAFRRGWSRINNNIRKKSY